MSNIAEFQGLVGKTITVKIDDDYSVDATIDAVEALKAPECDDENVRRDPFIVDITGPANQRIPGGIHHISGEGLTGQEVYIDPSADLNPEDGKVPYDIVFN